MWTWERHLLAGVLDELRLQSWQQRIHVRGKRHPTDKRPRPIPRPGVDDGTVKHGRTQRTPAEIRAWLAGMNPEEVDDGH